MESRRTAATEGRLRRLAEELSEEGMAFLLDGASAVLLEELDYALRPPVHERRIPSYGSILGATAPPDDDRPFAGGHLAADWRHDA